jgi:hypothetical protein
VRDGELSHGGHQALFGGHGGTKRQLAALPVRGKVRAALGAQTGGRAGRGRGGRR